MIHFKVIKKHLIFLSVICFFALSCEEEKTPSQGKGTLKKQVNSATNSFFSEELFDETSPATERELPCPGASEAQKKDLNHPQVIRGSVVAPRVHASSGFSFIREAYAVPIAGEFLMPKVEVQIVAGFEEKEVINATLTDALGRFCLVLPSTDLFTETHYLEAKVGGEVLRRLAPNHRSAVISTQSEAVFRLYQEHVKGKASLFPKSRMINLQTLADTRVDTLKPMQAKSSIEETVIWILDDLKLDPRIQAWIAR